jgi:hypothetical protein
MAIDVRPIHNVLQTDPAAPAVSRSLNQAHNMQPTDRILRSVRLAIVIEASMPDRR